MEHSLHLAAKHFVQTIAPHHKKTGMAGVDSEDDSASDGGGDDDGDDEAIDAGDSLGKAIAFVKQVGHVITPSISCTNSCNRFVSRHKLGCFSVQPAIKLGSPRWNYYYGFVHAGGLSSASSSVLSNSKPYVVIFLKSQAAISLLDRPLYNLFCSRMRAMLCQTSRKNAATQTST